MEPKKAEYSINVGFLLIKNGFVSKIDASIRLLSEKFVLWKYEMNSITESVRISEQIYESFSPICRFF